MTKENEQLSFDATVNETDDQPVVCLGMEFKNDDERREYFRNELRKKLPELKKIEGFPIGEDEDIIALSDPPYYTACPNPWINDFIEKWEKEKVEKYGRNTGEEYHREPFSSDIKEGKNDPIYNAHGYHTKVPYKAIMRYILHYTNPGDIVFDGFSGSGMTGVAAQLCGDRKEIEALGYTVDDEGRIFEKNESGKLIEFAELGKRQVVLQELSTAASFMSHVFNMKTISTKLEIDTNALMDSIIEKYSFLYLTFHDEKKNLEELFLKVQKAKNLKELRDIYDGINQDKFGVINYIVWSDVYICSNCSKEVVFYNSTVDREKKIVKKEMICPHCTNLLERNKLEKSTSVYYDKSIGHVIKIAKQIPVLINYSVNKKRYEKIPDEIDLFIIDFIKDYEIENWFPTLELPGGHNLDQPKRSHGIQNVSQFYFKRAILILSEFLSDGKHLNYYHSQFIVGSVLPKLTRMNRYMPQHGSRALVGPMANVLYLPPLCVENNAILQLEFQIKKIVRALNDYEGSLISTQSSTDTYIKDNSIDYIFIDPPFGANIMYSDLNLARESWLKVRTNNKSEAIENNHQNKSILEYRNLITDCLHEAFRILKPDHWITVEFSNTKASVWNAIQRALQDSGFIIASVDALDKKRGGLYSMITPVGVKQDLIITAYKPKVLVFENDITLSNDGSVFEFVENHLNQLPVYKGNKNQYSNVTEREPRIIFDRLIAYFVSKRQSIPFSAAQFQEWLFQKFPHRNGMVFLESQVAEYDKKRILVKEFSQQSLFVSDENSAIEWIRQQLMNKPQTRQDIHPNFMKEIQHIAKHEILPELDDLLNENFLQYEGAGEVPSQITTYLRRNYKGLRGLDAEDADVVAKAMNRWYVPDPSKQGDLERLRERALLREFDGYLAELEGNKRKLRQFRTEAIRAGFKKAYSEKDFAKIVEVGDRLPEKIIQEDDKLLMFYDNASMLVDM